MYYVMFCNANVILFLIYTNFLIKKMEEINKKITILRNEYELTQAEFGDKIGVSRGHVAALESGKYKPSIKLLNKIYREFNITDRILNLSIEDYVEEIKMFNPNHKWSTFPTNKEIELEKELKKQLETIDLLKENNRLLKEKIMHLENEIIKLSKNANNN